MDIANLLVLLCVVMSSTLTLSHRHHHSANNDPGEPLFLTPLIQQGKIADARQAAEVPCRYFANQKSYSGYLTINPQYNSNTFFWFFPAKVNTENAPLVIWLEGGPGASSLFGLFIENGPVEVTARGDIKPRRYSWNNYYNLIYIDNPIGSGYSFTENDAGYAKNEEDVGRDLHEAIKQLYKLFPEFHTLPLYISGSSYAGKFVPAIGYTILKAQQANSKTGGKQSTDINLAGLLIGNGFSDPITQIDYGQNLYSLGLIDEDGLKIFKQMEADIRVCIQKNDIDCVQAITRKLTVNESGFIDGTVFNNLTGYTNFFDFSKSEFDVPFLPMMEFVQKPSTRRLIHVGNQTFQHLAPNNKVEQYLKNDLIQSVAPWVAELLNHYRICVYQGQNDLEIPYWPTVRYLQKLQFDGAESYKTAKRQVWRVDNEVAGYVKEGGNLVEVLVRNAGHLATTDQPKWSLDMLKRFVNGEKFSN